MLPQFVLALGLAAAASADPCAVLAAILEAARAKHDVPAVAAWVSRRGEQVAVAAVGLRRADRPERVTLDDRFHLASVTKSLNATLVATLVDEGKLRWDETLEELFPDWPVHRALRGVTLAQLLAHRAGIAGFRGSGEFADAPKLYGDARAQRMQFTQWLLAQKPATEVGQFSYSNAGVAMAAAAVERVTGKPWEELMRERVFVPLGMTRAGFGWPGRVDAGEPWGHYLRGAVKVPHDPRGTYEVAQVLAPAADVHLSIRDLGAYLADQARGLAGKPALLKPESYRRMHGLVDKVPLGWMVVTVRKGASISKHEGSAETFYAIAAVGHEDALEVGVLLNEADPRAAAEVFATIWARFRAAGRPPSGG
jgi:CubicO group peptidase (beta-lactamase class C family)